MKTNFANKPKILQKCQSSYLRNFIVSHVSCQSSQWLTSRPTHSNKEGVASGLFEDSGDSWHMLNSKPRNGQIWIKN